MLPPGKLKPAKRNARTHNEAQIDLLANSILRFGVIKPVVIDDRGRVVAGHGMWWAAKKLGLKQIPVIRVSHLSETELRAYALADNQLATKSGWDRQLLSLEFADLQVDLPEIGLDLTFARLARTARILIFVRFCRATCIGALSTRYFSLLGPRRDFPFKLGGFFIHIRIATRAPMSASGT